MSFNLYENRYVVDFSCADAVVDGNALAAHYAFRHQSAGLETTDVLARYKSYADEMVCSTL